MRINISAEKKILIFDSVKKLVVEILTEVLSAVISKLISGGAAGPQTRASLGIAHQSFPGSCCGRPRSVEWAVPKVCYGL